METPITDAFLKMYSELLSAPAEQALYIILSRNKEAIEPLLATRDPLWLHKAFRQVDVTNFPGEDMVIWHLLNVAPVFWETVEYFFNSVLFRREERSNIVRLKEMTDNCEKLLGIVDSLVQQCNILPDEDTIAIEQIREVIYEGTNSE